MCSTSVVFQPKMFRNGDVRSDFQKRAVPSKKCSDRSDIAFLFIKILIYATESHPSFPRQPTAKLKPTAR